jgi:hypothetical protein
MDFHAAYHPHFTARLPIMKLTRQRQRFLLLVPICLWGVFTELLGMDLVLKDGRKLTKVEFITEDEKRVKLMHDAGLAWVDKTQVPEDFLKANGVTLPEGGAAAMKSDSGPDERLVRLKKEIPTFRDKDGRTRNTSEVSAIEPTGLKFVIDSAVVRVPFHKLPKPVADLLGMDADAVQQAKSDLENSQTSAREEHNLRMTATSILARQKCYVDLEIVQYEKDGYICYGTVLERKVEQVEAEVDYNRLKRQKVVQTQNVETLEAGRSLGRMKVYGLPAELVGKKTWRGELWLGGWRAVETAQGETVDTRDAFTALQSGVEHLVKHGLGNLVEDLGESRKGPETSPVDPFGSPMQPGVVDPFAPGSRSGGGRAGFVNPSGGRPSFVDPSTGLVR